MQRCSTKDVGNIVWSRGFILQAVFKGVLI